jgi:hypothetical protein
LPREDRLVLVRYEASNFLSMGETNAEYKWYKADGVLRKKLPFTLQQTYPNLLRGPIKSLLAPERYPFLTGDLCV